MCFQYGILAVPSTAAWSHYITWFVCPPIVSLEYLYFVNMNVPTLKMKHSRSVDDRTRVEHEYVKERDGFVEKE